MTESKLSSCLQKRRNTILLTLALALYAVFAVYFFINVYRYTGNFPNKRYAYGLLVASAIAGGLIWLCYYLLKHKDIKIETLFVFFMLTAGVIYAAVFLPFTIPDEGEHYLSAYRISNYITFNTDQIGEERLLIRSCDLELISRLRANALSPEYYSSLANNFQMFAADRSASFIPAKFIGSAPAGYIASALGISLGRALHLGALPTFYLGRFANLGLYTFAVWWAMKRIPYGKTALFVISAFPMVIHLVASYSYDFLVIALAMLFVSQVLYMREKPGKVSIPDIILCAVYSILLAPAKLVYFPILLLIFLVPSEKFGFSKKTAALIKCGIIAVGIAALLIMQLGKISTYMSDGNSVSWSNDEVYSVSHVLTHPLEFLRILFNTFYHYTDYYSSMIIGNHMDGTGGVILPVFLWSLMIPVTVFSFLRRKDEEPKALQRSTRFWCFVLFAGICILALLSMLFSWTPVSSNVIRGVQGRYFIPALPLLFLAMRGDKLLRPANSDKYIIFFCIYYNLLMPMVYFGQLFLPEFA